MTGHPNFEVARRLWEAIADGDADGLRALFDEKCSWHLGGRSPLAGHHVGSDAVLAFMARVGELSDELEAELIDILVSDRGAVLRYAIEARRGPASLEIEQLCVIEVEDDRIVEAQLLPVDQERYDRFWLSQ